jgi:hypothetical protein
LVLRSVRVFSWILRDKKVVVSLCVFHVRRFIKRCRVHSGGARQYLEDLTRGSNLRVRGYSSPATAAPLSDARQHRRLIRFERHAFGDASSPPAAYTRLRHRR